MANAQLARLERVDVRVARQSEAGDFTPWLAQEENLALLGETVGLDLELEAKEQKVGPFRADVLCKDSATGNWVLIENQLERTDHSHLGQLLTYAAGLKAVTIIWIADAFTDEHRAALDWLNEVIDESINFFGLEVELWRIGDSPCAPKFNIISKPNDWSRTISAGARQIQEQALTTIKQLQLDYWTALREVLLKRKGVLKPQKPLPQNWTTYSLGRSIALLEAVLNTRTDTISVQIDLNDQYAKAYFHLLLEQRSEIEADIGEPLDWLELANRKSRYIALKRRQSNLEDRTTWPVQHAWLAEKPELMHRVFAPRIRVLNAGDYKSDADAQVGVLGLGQSGLRR